MSRSAIEKIDIEKIDIEKIGAEKIDTEITDIGRIDIEIYDKLPVVGKYCNRFDDYER